MPEQGLILTRGCTLNVSFSIASNIAKFTANSWEIKKMLKTLCDSNNIIPLLLETNIDSSKSLGKACVVFNNEKECSEVSMKLHRQLITINKIKYFAECEIITNQNMANIKEQDQVWQQIFKGNMNESFNETSLISILRKLWKHGGSYGEKPDTLIVNNLPAKWFNIDTNSLNYDGDDNDNVQNLKTAFERFGNIKYLDIIHGNSVGSSLLSGGALGLGGLNITCKICFEEPEGVAVALAALRDAILTKDINTSSSSTVGGGIRLGVEMDVSGYFKKSQIHERSEKKKNLIKKRQEIELKCNQMKFDAKTIIENMTEKLNQLKKSKLELEENQSTCDDETPISEINNSLLEQDEDYKSFSTMLISTESILNNAVYVVNSNVTYQEDETMINLDEESCPLEVEAKNVLDVAKQAETSILDLSVKFDNLMKKLKNNKERKQREEERSREIKVYNYICSMFALLIFL